MEEKSAGSTPWRVVQQVCMPPPDDGSCAHRPSPRHSAGPPPSPPHSPSGDGADLVDSTLLEEITLLSEVIVTVSAYPTHLNGEEIDDVLGVGARVPHA
ncbi:hypothetical protein GCM10009740_23430 [Terrabacter terrae]|uniref:Uncharacterized protein n=1 Tax=Terrabacter terrae TaxID=318434 RepID=A0ABN2UAH4_9MICO